MERRTDSAKSPTVCSWRTPNLVEFLIADQGIGHISESVLNRLPVSDQSLLMLRFGQMQIPAKCAPRENRLTYLRAVRPDSNLRTHQAREGAAASECAASRTGQRNLRKELGLGDADFGIRGNEDLLGFANIGPTLEQRRRQAGRHVRRKRLLDQRTPARYALRVVAEEDADGIFLLRNLPLEVRDLRICGIEHLLSLQHIELGGHAVVKSERSQFDGIFLCLDRVSRDL